MIPPDILFLALAGIAFLGFVLDSLFHRIRVSSVLPLMLLGVALVATGAVPAGTLSVLNTFIPYVSALTVAFILFAVGLEVRFSELFRVLGRATAYTLVVQTSTGVVLGLLAYETLHWNLLISFIFGFALSGPSSIAVPVLVRVARMPESLRTTLLFESVISDVLQLLVPLLMIGLLVQGTVSAVAITSTLLWTVLGSTVGGIAAGIAWLAILDRLRSFAEGYTWTLTITMVLATYGAADRLGLSPAISIFVFGLTLGNGALLDFRQRAGAVTGQGWLSGGLSRVRARLGLSTRALDIPHILQVQREVSFFASSFFFVYIGLLFRSSELTLTIVVVAIVASLVMLALRFASSPILHDYLGDDPATRRSLRALLSFNISRGLAAAVVATVPQGLGIIIPGFLDAIFLGILLSTFLSTVGIFVLYRPETPASEAPPTTLEFAFPALERARQERLRVGAETAARAPPPSTAADLPPTDPPPLPRPRAPPRDPRPPTEEPPRSP